MANNQVPSVPSDKRAAIDAFRKKLVAQAAGVAPGQHGRLIFGVDCTASREHCWEMACQLQVEMFEEAAKTGEFEIQLAIYRGSQFETSDWVSDGRALAEKMRQIDCITGFTQIEKVLAHALGENQRQKIQAVVLVVDAMEEKEETLFAVARELGARGVPAFLFQEGDHPDASRVFAEIAKLTKGAHCQFTAGAACELADLLRAVAAYAAGGRNALLANKTTGAAKLLLQLPPR
jgi:hypothetical protein